MSVPGRVGELVDSAPDGSSFLLSGPAMTGKYELLVGLLAGADALAVATDTDAATIREDYRAQDGTGTLSVVDCASRPRGVETADAEGVRYVSGPGNLTRIGTAFTDLLDRRSETVGRVGLHSVSPLLIYSKLRSVYRFLQVFTGQVRSAGWACFATFDPTMHDERTTNTVLDPFDVRIETRENEGRREARITGLGPESSDWLAF
ncbi:DUF7504 family protein [Halalkalicoccus subterraneus]|uniref:DUF7504 family protein n=1 Tax=Halalkalicoccus subterraneus TaxID=2675002 RepID=UPI001FE2B2B5|nr:hypothetical protein [Halalkalicoccus subterraneus]